MRFIAVLPVTDIVFFSITKFSSASGISSLVIGEEDIDMVATIEAVDEAVAGLDAIVVVAQQNRSSMKP